MNNNKKVIILVITVFVIYLSLSVFSNNFINYLPNFKNVNLIADILKKEKPVKIKKVSLKQNIVNTTNIDSTSIDTTALNNFEAYKQKGTIVNFEYDTITPSLKKLTQKLQLLAQNKKIKIRIAWFGDSQIEGDFVTQDLRNLLQNYFGKQAGVGFVPINSISSEFRQTAKITTNGFIKTNNFKKMDNNSSLFFSGYSFFSNDLNINFKDNVKKNLAQINEKWLLYGKGDSITIKMNDSIVKKYAAESDFNRILIDKSTSNTVQFQVMGKKTPIYGISSEPETGIVLDNFSFRGITGVELKNLNNNLLNKLNETGYYDLIVFQYGVNLMFKPKDTNYDYYYKIMNPVLKNLKNNLNKSEFLLLSCSDRAFKYDNEWKTAIGIDSLVYTQAKLAYDNKMLFYNFYKSIGGQGTIVKWADSTVQCANKDYIHFNHRGSQMVANTIFKAIIKDYKKSTKKTNKQPVLSKSNTQKDSTI